MDPALALVASIGTSSTVSVVVGSSFIVAAVVGTCSSVYAVVGSGSIVVEAVGSGSFIAAAVGAASFGFMGEVSPCKGWMSKKSSQSNKGVNVSAFHSWYLWTCENCDVGAMTLVPAPSFKV